MPKKFYIIDGHAQIYRAYFAPFRDLTSPTGEPTKATFVFTQMLINLVEKRKPDYLAMVIDHGDESVFRREIFPEYKANRKPAPDDFHPQEQRILQIVKDAGVPIFFKPGFEADDLIATMAAKLDDDFEVYLVSKDKDLRQVLSDRIRMYDVQSDEEFGPLQMLAKVGYTPAQAVEVQTLMGDAIDNIPGIPGVGEKTAAKLIEKYGTADAVLQHLDELTPKMRENFQTHGEKLKLSRQLVTLKKDVEFDWSVQGCEFKGLNSIAVLPHLNQLGFTTLAKRLGADVDQRGGGLSRQPGDAPKPAKPTGEIGLFRSMDDPSSAPLPQTENSSDHDYKLINTPELLDAFMKAVAEQKRIAIDTETDALGAMSSNCIGVSVSWQPKTGYYIAVCGPSGSTFLDRDVALGRLKAVLEDDSIEKVGHNIKYDLQVLKQWGINVRGVVMDTMIAAFLIDPTRNQYGIDSLALNLLNFKKIATEELIGKGKAAIGMDKVDLDRVARYASEDVDITLRLSQLFDKKLNDLPQIRKLMDEMETPLVDVLVEMEGNGIAVDPAILKEQSIELGHRIDDLKQAITKEAGTDFNPDSPKQLADVLFSKLGLKVVKKTKTGPSTDVEVLEKLSLDHAVPKLMLEYRSLTKLKSTYLDNLGDYINARTKRIHANFSQIGAETGRLSCSDPNLQNIPIRSDEGRAIRLAFVPGDREKNVLLTADYSQIELRVLAHFTEEPALVKAFENDEDIHRAVAAEVFHVPLDQVSKEQRNQAKVVNFGIIYGVTAFGLARRIEGLSVPAAQELISSYNKRFPRILQFMQECVMKAQDVGYVETIRGRRRPLPDIGSAVINLRNMSERMAINSVVQGSAADMIKIAMLKVQNRLRDDKRPSKLLLQVHDELVFETPRDAVEAEAAIVREEMQNAMKLKVPIKVEVGWGKNWEEGK